MKQTSVTNSPEQTQQIAKQIANRVKNGGIVCLYGDLGSGKTTFTQGFAKALGITQSVNSPTFLVVRTYTVDSNVLVNQKFYHIDLYRLETENELRDIGLSEIIADNNNIVVIEWSEKLGSFLPKQRIDVHLTYQNETDRSIAITTYE